MKSFFVFTLVFITTASMAQIGMPDNDQYEKLKGRTLHIQMNDTTSPANKAMMKAVRMAWTVSQPEFIAPEKVNSLLKPGNFFVTLEHDNTSFNFIRERTSGYGERRLEYSPAVKNDYFYLHFWTLADNYDAAKGLKSKNQNTVARAELYLQSIGTGLINYSSRNIGSPGFQREFCNGLPGYIKCIFQVVSNNIQKNVTVKLKKDLDISPELANLRKDTLYVPNYWFGPGGTMLPDEPENSANGRYIKKLLESYNYPIRLIRRDELSDKLMSTTKPLYFFNYVQSSADKMLSVVNGLTGETLYYNFNDKSYRPKPKNFKDISDEVEKL
jgi:hypothetical protein